MMILELKDIKKEFKGKERSVLALNGVSLSLSKGDFVNIIGKSGSGKSTLLNVATGLTRQSSGEVILCGNSLKAKSEKEICILRNRDIGIVSQGTASFPNLTVLENVMLPACLYFDRELDVRGKAMYALDKLGIAGIAKAYPRQLSGGEARRMLIARAIMNEPKLLVADEPCSDLDVENTDIVMKLIKSLNDEGMTVLLVSHDLDTLHYGKTIYTMSQGKLLKGNNLRQG